MNTRTVTAWVGAAVVMFTCGCGIEFDISNAEASSSGDTGSGGGGSVVASGGGGASSTSSTGGGQNSCENFALRFDGVDDFVEVPDHPDLDTFGPFTIEAWVKVEGKTLTTEGQILSHHNGDGNAGYVLMIEGDAALHLRFQGAGASYRSGTPAESAIDDQWHHVAGSFDGTTLRVFIDGELRASDPSPIATADDYAGPLHIGAAAYNDKWRFEGLIDEAHLSNVARYAESCTPPTSRSAADASSVALWHFDEGSGQVAADATGNFHGVLGFQQSAEGEDPAWEAAPCIDALQAQ